MRKRLLFFIVSLVIVIIFLFVRSVVTIISVFEEQSDTQMFENNTVLDKNSLKLYDIRTGKDTVIFFEGVQVLNFWASWCKPCLDEMPELHKLQEKYKKLKVSLLSFDDTSKLNKTLKEKKISLPAYSIVDTSLFKIPKMLPRTIVLSGNTVIRDMYVARKWTSDEYRLMFDTLLGR